MTGTYWVKLNGFRDYYFLHGVTDLTLNGLIPDKVKKLS